MIPLLMLCFLTIGFVEGECESRRREMFEYKTRFKPFECLSCFNFTSTTIDLYGFDCDLSESNILDLYNAYYPVSYQNDPYQGQLPLYMKLIFDARTAELAPEANRGQYSFTQLWRLDYSENNISKIYPGYFSSFTVLKELSLAKNLLTSVDEDVFSLMPVLQTLNMSHNIISIVNEYSFKDLLDLFTIDLSFNHITHLPEKVFSYQNHLELILLNNNQIKHFSLNLQSYLMKPSVDLSFNNLSTFDVPYNFKNLSLSSNKLTYFSLSSTESLMSLNLSYNRITSLNSSLFLNALNLRVLDVNHNLLTSMPTSSFKNSKKVEYVDVSHNLFHENTYGKDNNWISFFLNFKFLKTINLDGNSWSCSDLKDIIHTLTSEGVKIVQGNKHDDNHMLGIKCWNVTNNKSDNVNFNPFESVEMLVDQLIRQEINESRSKIESLSTKIQQISDQLNKFMLRENLTKASNAEERDKILTDHFAALLDDKISNLQNKLQVVPPVEKNLVEPQKMEKANDHQTGNTGLIINNIFLFVIACGLGFLVYVYFKGKPLASSSLRENINLV